MIDKKELEITAALAQMELQAGELERLGQEVSQMLEYFAKMSEVDTQDLEPTTHALVKDNRLRADAVQASVKADAVLDRAPELEDRLLVIPNVL